MYYESEFIYLFFFFLFCLSSEKEYETGLRWGKFKLVNKFLARMFFFCLIGSRSSLRFHHCHLATPQMQWSSRIVDEERCRVEKEDIKQRFAAIWSHAVVMSGALN